MLSSLNPSNLAPAHQLQPRATNLVATQSRATQSLATQSPTSKALPCLGTSPFSVMMPAMRAAGVTSKEGFHTCGDEHVASAADELCRGRSLKVPLLLLLLLLCEPVHNHRAQCSLHAPWQGTHTQTWLSYHT